MAGQRITIKWSSLWVLILYINVKLNVCCWATETNLDAKCRKQMEDQLDTSYMECENFYDYACGNWYVSYALRTFGAHDMRTQMRALNRQQMVRYFMRQQEQEQEQEQEEEERHEQAAKKQPEHQHLVTFYSSCLNGRQSLHVYTNVMQLLPNIQWPILLGNHSRVSPFDWYRANAGLRQFGAQGLWRLIVRPNWQAAEQQIFYMLPPKFDLLGGHRNDEEAEFLYQRYLKNLLLELGLKVRRAALLAEQLVTFERQLRELMDDNVTDQSWVLHEPQMLKQLISQLPQLHLQEYFDILFGEQAPEEILIVANLNYLQGLQRLLRNADTLILSTWLLLQLPAHFELHLNDDAKLIQQRENCLEKMNHLLPRQLARLQLTLYRQEEGQDDFDGIVDKVHELFENLKMQFERVLNETTIFERDETTQSRARDKLRAMRLIQPWFEEPRRLRIPNVRGNIISGITNQMVLPMLSSNYDENLLNLSKRESFVQFREVLNCIHLPCHVDSYGSISSGPLDVNAYYRLSGNVIVLPMGLLRSPLISSCAPIEAGLGYILSHEMLHAFDYDGINYDADGNGQWPPRAIIRFGLRAGCYLGARYNNATLTINENIADSEGLRLAYETYRWRINQEEQKQLQKEYNQNQRSDDKIFFTKFAQNWCGHEATSATTIGQHATHRERVNNVLGNFPEFAETFHCKVGNEMDPADKCRIW